MEIRGNFLFYEIILSFIYITIITHYCKNDILELLALCYSKQLVVLIIIIAKTPQQIHQQKSLKELLFSETQIETHLLPKRKLQLTKCIYFL